MPCGAARLFLLESAGSSTRVAAAETEQALLDVALAGTAAHVEQVVRAWRRVDRTAEAADERRRHASRRLHTWVDDDGMVVIRGRLTPEVGAVVRRALEAALDVRAARRRRAVTGRQSDPVDEAAGVAPSFGQRHVRDPMRAVARVHSPGPAGWTGWDAGRSFSHMPLCVVGRGCAVQRRHPLGTFTARSSTLISQQPWRWSPP